MEAKLTFKYDRKADTLHIDKCPACAEQESEELADEVLSPSPSPCRSSLPVK